MKGWKLSMTRQRCWQSKKYSIRTVETGKNLPNRLYICSFFPSCRIFFGRNISTLTFAAERWQSGRMRRSWKPLTVKGPGVRIPLSPLKGLSMINTWAFFMPWPMPYYTYILKSLSDNGYYNGHTSDVVNRLQTLVRLTGYLIKKRQADQKMILKRN